MEVAGRESTERGRGWREEWMKEAKKIVYEMWMKREHQRRNLTDWEEKQNREAPLQRLCFPTNT